MNLKMPTTCYPLLPPTIFVLRIFSVPLRKIVIRQVKKEKLVKEERMREIFYDI